MAYATAVSLLRQPAFRSARRPLCLVWLAFRRGAKWSVLSDGCMWGMSTDIRDERGRRQSDVLPMCNAMGSAQDGMPVLFFSAEIVTR